MCRQARELHLWVRWQHQQRFTESGPELSIASVAGYCTTLELVGQFGAKTPTQLLNSSKAVLWLGLLASCDFACSVVRPPA